MNKKKPLQKPKPPLNNYVKYSSLAIQMVVLIVIFVWGGRKLDLLLSLKFPVFTLILSIAGVFVAIYFAIKDFLKKT